LSSCAESKDPYTLSISSAAARYENGVFKSIVYSGANYTMAGGINNNGLISGQIYLTGNNTLGYTAICK
jgi:hypothetical protein